MTLATEQDVETSLMRELTTSESQYVGPLLERVEALLSVKLSDLTARAANEPNFGKVAVAVEAEAVARVFRNPEAFKQETEGNYGYSLNFEVASGLLDILEREWLRLGVSVLGSIAPIMDGYASARG